MKKCKKCGLQLMDEASFCIRCGSPLEAPAAKVERSAQPNVPSHGSGGNTPPQSGGNSIPPQGSWNSFPPQGDGSSVPPQGGGNIIPTQGNGNNTSPQSGGQVPTSQSESAREDMIQQYLNRVKEKEAAKQEQKKASILTKIGLTNRVYTNDYTNGQQHKDVPIEVSDEEWREIAEAYQAEQNLIEENPTVPQNAGSNDIARALKVIGYVTYAVAFILGIVLGTATNGPLKGLGAAAAILFWFAGFIVGTVMLGFGEIVRLLQEISNNGQS